MDIEKIKKLSDFIKEMEETAIDTANDEKEAKFIELFSGETAPTAEDVANFAEENEMDIEEVFQKINDMLHDCLTKEEEGEFEEDMKLLDPDSKEVTEEEDLEHEAEESPEEEREEHESGEETPDEFPFEVGNSVSYSTENPDNMFYGRKFDVIDIADIGNGDGFVQVMYVDEDGEETTMWFRVDEVKLENDGGGEEEGSFEPEENKENKEEEEEEEENKFEEDYGILSHMKKIGLYSLNG